MSKIVFTREVTSDAIYDSEVVDEVYYNENTRDLYVDLDPGDVYKYSNVPVDVVNEFQKAESAGHFYAKTIKPLYGPGENLGRWNLLDYDEVDVVAQDVISNTSISVGNSGIFATGGVIIAPKPSVFDLKPFPEGAKVEGVEREYRVTFEVTGILDHKTHTLKAKSVDEAVQAVLDLGKMLDLTFIVREVTIRFE